MKRQTLLFITGLCAAAIFSSCTASSPNPVGNNNSDYYSTVDTTFKNNGFVITGGGYSHDTLAFNQANIAVASPGNTYSDVFLIGFIRNNVPMTAKIHFPSARGTYPVQNTIAAAPDSTQAYLVLNINRTEYLSINGSVVVGTYKDVVSNETSGTFTGALATVYGDTITVTNGRFEVTF